MDNFLNEIVKKQLITETDFYKIISDQSIVKKENLNNFTNLVNLAYSKNKPLFYELNSLIKKFLPFAIIKSQKEKLLTYAIKINIEKFNYSDLFERLNDLTLLLQNHGTSLLKI